MFLKMRLLLSFAIFQYSLLIVWCDKFEIDPNGYIMFCPCMGRLGNQIDQFLGALSFAKEIDRTIVLPHLVEYPRIAKNSDQIPFQTYFKVEPLKEYTKVILMDDFMKYLAPKIWPQGNRTIFCYGPRGSNNKCNAKEGNPFGPFWDKFNIDFDNDEFYGPLGYDASFGDDKNAWKIKYPSKIFPVLAFAGAPGAFPVLEKNVYLQKYLKWSDTVEAKADEFLKNFFKPNENEKFIGLHLRNGIDFKNACEHAKKTKTNFFASAQCLGYSLEKGEMTDELCDPSEKTIMKQLHKALKKYEVKHVYVATDDKDMIEKFSKKFKKVKFSKYPTNDPHVDLCILGKADFSIVNCISSFSAFAKRQRDSEGKPTEFWAFEPKQNIKKTEL